MENREDAAPARCALEQAPLRALLLANYLSWFGNGMTLVAVPIYVLARTGSTMAAGVAGAANALPLIIAGVAGGVLVDRWGARRSSILADGLAGLCTAAVPILAQSVPLAAIVLLLFLRSLLSTPGNVAKQTLLPSLADLAGVGRQTANTLYQLAPRLALIAGPALAGISISLVGAATTLIFDAMTFVASSVLIAAFVPPIGQLIAASPRPSFLQEMGTGLGFIRRDRGLMTMLSLILAMNFIDEAYIPVLLPVYSRDILGDPRLVGWLLGSNGFGAVLGTVLYLFLGARFSALRWATFVVCLAVLAVTRAGLAGLPSLTGSCCMLFAFGLASGPVNPVINTVVQEVTPQAILGRVFGVMRSTSYAAAPLGILVAGWVVAKWGLQVGLVAFGTLYMLVFIAAWCSRSLNDFADRPSTVVD
jgi:MFS family permease